ncbi:MAG: S24/S26 family peptidase [Labilithrix sp.]|nr:S24/S26 family peptidase [Labilithrix sp.]MCW5809908.1 S24/S26 family peptidase [Labilithrix sp.]
MFRVVRVNGPSMAPTLVDGDFVVVIDRPCRIGDVVVVMHPQYGRIVKRVAARDGSGRIALEGDGALSTSREALGWTSPHDVLGRVCLRVRR